jgi:hypothetical protein
MASNANSDVDQLIAFGKIALEQGWYDKAHEYFEQALALDASKREAMRGLARVNEILSRRAGVPVKRIQYKPVQPLGEVEQERSISEKGAKGWQRSLTQWFRERSRPGKLAVMVGVSFLLLCLCVGLASKAGLIPETMLPLLTLWPTATPTPEPGYSIQELNAYLEQAEPLLEEFSDTLKIAESTSGIALPPIVSDLQRIRRDFRRLKSPAIAETAHEHFGKSMQFDIDAFLALMAHEPDQYVETTLQSAREYMWQGNEALEKAKAEAQ